MKILKKAKFLPIECKKCGTIFKPNKSDIRRSDLVFCPICGHPTTPKYNKGADNEQREAD